MLTLAYVLIVCSACVHASWNACTRHLKGNTSLLVLAHIGGTIFFTPIAIIYGGGFFSVFQDGTALTLLVLSSLTHASYVILLANAYKYGDVGLVYPLARGTAIMLSSIAAQFLQIDPPYDTEEIIGVMMVLAGIFGLSYDAIRRAAVPDSSTDDTGKETKSAVRMHGIVYEKVATRDTDDTEAATGAGSIEFASLESEFDTHSRSAASSGQSGGSKTSGSSYGKTTVVNPSSFPVAATTAPAAAGGSSKKLLMSIGFALSVGICTAAYSIFDSTGVRLINPLVWNCWGSYLSFAVIGLPYIMTTRYEEMVTCMSEHRFYVVVMSPMVIGAYLIILIVFSLPETNVAITVTLREFSVLIGAFIGVVVLKEPCGWQKMLAICCILTGMVLIKLGS